MNPRDRSKVTIRNLITLQRCKWLEWIKNKFHAKLVYSRFRVFKSSRKLTSMSADDSSPNSGYAYHIEKFQSVHIVWKQSNLSSSRNCENRFQTDVDTLLHSAQEHLELASFFFLLLVENIDEGIQEYLPCASQFYLLQKHFYFLSECEIVILAS